MNVIQTSLSVKNSLFQGVVMETKTQEKTPRQRILDTAIRLFFQKGYLATGINQIIEEAEVCKASFYSNFPSKEDLCLEYIETSHDQWMALLEEEINKQKRPYERLMSIFIFLEHWMSSCSYRGCGLMNISSETPELKGRIRKLIQERNHMLKNAIHGLVKDLKISDPKFTNIDMEEVASFLLMIIQGAVTSSQAHADTAPIRHAKKSFKRFLESY
jgi:AcrR family transcriptional regulator